MKTFILVIVISILIGVGIFFGDKVLHTKTAITPQELQEVPKSTEQVAPSPSPIPPGPMIDKNSNLEDEVNKLTVPDYTEDFKNLRAN